MATYAELYAQKDNQNLIDRIEVALVIKAQSYLDGASTAPQRAWARQVFADGQSEARRMLKYLLAKNKDATIAQITAVTDASLSTQVNAVADAFVAGFAGV